MKKGGCYAALGGIIFLWLSCAHPVIKPEEDNYAEPVGYNFRFIARDEGIEDPSLDRRSYYRIFIDKAEEGRTSTGLESQDKVYEGTLSPNRHLVTVEKWVLDEREGRYVKLNNVDQPKPNFFYFDVPEKRVVVLTMTADRDGNARFTVSLEKKRRSSP